MLNSYVPTILASWLLNNNNNYIYLIILKSRGRDGRGASQHLSRFDIRENQITLSRVQCYAVALMETECTERVGTSEVSNQIAVTLIPRSVSQNV